MESPLEYMESPYPSFPMSIYKPVPCLKWIHLALTVFNVCMTVTVLIIVAVMCNELTTTLQDVRELVPEVARVLTMVTHLCDTPDFSPYCGPQAQPPGGTRS